MKILFLDFDGVLNAHHATVNRWRCFIGLDPKMGARVERIVALTGCRIVLSSAWRSNSDWMEAAREQAGLDLNHFIDETPDRRGLTSRGSEIKEWIDERLAHAQSKSASVEACTRYAIIDDNSDMLEEQKPSFFQTAWNVGLTDEIADRVIAHLNA